MAECHLCKQPKILLDSHAIPAFAVRWIKETSATPYLRGGTNPNRRKQDIGTIKLLCKECEAIFSREETNFASKIFHPYVSKELDEKGCGRGVIREFSYSNWLLRFALSLQWRTLATRPNRVNEERIFAEVEKTWRQFLLNERKDSGPWETHMLFLQSFGGAVVPDTLKLGYRVNMYVLHSVDATTVSSDSKSHLGIYSKIGPIAFYTPVKPTTIKGNPDSKLHLNGKISVGQNLRNAWLNEFIFINRPDEVRPKLSEKQLKKIQDTALLDPLRTLNSMTLHLLKVDYELERRKK
jgi:hypothetical protein